MADKKPYEPVRVEILIPVVRCGECWKRKYDNCPFNEFSMFVPPDDFYCKDGEREPDDA